MLECSSADSIVLKSTVLYHNRNSRVGKFQRTKIKEEPFKQPHIEEREYTGEGRKR